MVGNHARGDDRMSKRRLTEDQLKAIVELAKPDRDTYDEIAKKIGISHMTLYRWRQDDAFNEELKRQVLRGSVDYLPQVFASIPRHIIEEGNAAMLRTYLQSLGMLTEKVEVDNKGGSGSDIDGIKAEIERMKGSGGNTD